MTTADIQNYQQRRLIEAKMLLATTEGLLIFMETQGRLLPSQAKLKDDIAAFQKHSLFPKEAE